MDLARGRVAALTVAVAVMVGAGACGGADGGGGGPAGAQAGAKDADPKAALLGSLKEYDKGVYGVSLTALDGRGQGRVNVARKQAYIKMVSTDPEAAFTMELLVVEPHSYVKMDLGGVAALPGLGLLSGDKWLHLDRSKVKGVEALTLHGDDADLAGVRGLLGSAGSVRRAGDRAYSGTLDLTKGERSPVTDEDVVRELGAKAAAVPFTAAVDARGRLAELRIDVPAAGDHKAHALKLAFSGYGSVTLPARPTGAKVADAPDEVYDMFRN
ncbi:MAG TPA: hypothetical protein VFT95_15995 [Micromonosporaceae bacterium]|nr:hypothetical protein [Micromonosporaceae bacterium]